MPLLNNELARRENGRVELRPGPMRVRWNLDDLVTADGHRLHCAFSCSIAALADPTERKMLEEVFLARAFAVTSDAVISHFEPGLRAAAAKVAGEHKADEWIKKDLKQPMIDALREAGKVTAFSAGVEILPPFHIEFDSPSFASQQVEEMERTLAERRVAGQVEHFERASKLLKQFQELKEAAPDLAPSEILKQISPADQGTMLQTLLLAAGKAKSTACLWAVAGTSLVKIDGRAQPASLEVVDVPQNLGPLRSVQPGRVDGQDVLLVGARSGVMTYDPATRASIEYADPSIDSQLGFSRVVVWNGQVWGCHGEAGIVSWTLGQTQRPTASIRPAELRTADNPPPVPGTPPPLTSMSISTRTAGIRNLEVLDEDRLIFSVGYYLTTIDKSGLRVPFPMPTSSEVLAILPDADRAIIVQDDGTLSVRDRKTLEMKTTQRRTGRVTAATTLPWLGARRLLLASDEGPVYLLSVDDEVVGTYLSSHRGLRVLSAAVDIVAAVSSDRQRVVLWNAWDGKKPVAELNIAAATRHRVGDIEFA